MNREELLEKYSESIQVLDHGFVRLVDCMGSDAAIVQAARTSYGAGTKTAREDRGLIRHLMRNAHTSPLEMCEIKLHCKMPIFVARQWVRHRTASLNEVSGRYSVLKNEYYLPEDDRIRKQSKVNKQGSGEPLKYEDEGSFYGSVEWVNRLIDGSSDIAFNYYERFVDKDVDLAREVARIHLPLNTYTQWYWKMDLHNLLHFLRLRLDEHAQWEIRQYAQAIASIVKDWVPYTWEAFEDFRLHAHTFSRQEMALLGNLMDVFKVLSCDSKDAKNPWIPDRKMFEELFERFDITNKREQAEFLCVLGFIK